MAIYHFHVEQISRGKGQSVVASAAYRAGEKLHDNYYGETIDYTRKGGVIVTEIMTPDYVPESLHERERLWNEVESIEKHPKAQLAYSFDIALMNELTQEENWELSKHFVQENFLARGMICDVAFHEPEKDGVPNPHIHVICPIRPMNEDGTWGDKQRREYLVDENGEPILDGKGKQKYNAVSTTDWGKPETLNEWRRNWAELVNATFREKGIEVSIDNRSYREQGIDLIPQIHEGPHVREMEKKGIRTEKGELNRFIKEINHGISSLRKKLKEIIEIITKISEELKEEKERAKAPSLADCLISYIDARNEKARSYTYGQSKARIANTKLLSSMLIYLQENNICTIDELLQHAEEKRGVLQNLGESGNQKKTRISEIKEILRYDAWYKAGLPIMREIEKAKFTKKKEVIKAEHADTLNRFYVARRILTERGLIDKVDVASLQKEVAELVAGARKEYDEYKSLSKDIKQLEEICSFAQKAVRPERQIKHEEITR